VLVVVRDDDGAFQMSNLSLSLSLSRRRRDLSLAKRTKNTTTTFGERTVGVVGACVGGVEHTLREYYHTSNVVQSRDVEKKIAFCIVEYYSQTSSVFCQVL
jgi:hypothetical protein